MQNEYKTKKCFKYLNKIHKYEIKHKKTLHFYAKRCIIINCN